LTRVGLGPSILSGREDPWRINTALNASKDAIEQLIIRARHKERWIRHVRREVVASQIVEHVARSLEESANMAAGRPSKFPKLHEAHDSPDARRRRWCLHALAV